MPKNVITLDGKRALAWKNFKLASEKGNLGQQRFVDLQWFWDPSKTWILPTRCVNYKAIISAEILSGCAKDDSGLSEVNCPECFETFYFKIQKAGGSPLNLALIGHWDAWQPFRTSFRSCGSIEISIANMYKKDRAHVKEVYVVDFG